MDDYGELPLLAEQLTGLDAGVLEARWMPRWASWRAATSVCRVSWTGSATGRLGTDR
jgi:hypothetical protein